MTHEKDIEHLIFAAHALARMTAAETGSQTPAAQWRTIAFLEERGPLRLGELAALSRVTQPGITRLTGQMADAGLVERTADPADSRVTVISLTDAGSAALDQWRTQLTAALAPRFDDLDEREWEALRTTAAVLARKTGALEATR
ncbi:MarR family winged helix-turn-helix transcriptional regulator [Microbacterium fluvii]|uniref:MarR family winged helix-turn-helix transcriptional regulator n=1 Tax=Microbacterium fluvii TaxID=415215 RepID=A0ABW2HDH2_9MICO|nr:MarR family transcriptional regulator [Microbacterium fluvii]MCU4672168.1 MarR family transcriptional regulator [Microbacterium fluvii]